MEMICPECRGELQPVGGGRVTCPLHGGEFEVLFDRETQNGSTASSARRDTIGRTGVACAAHPNREAIFTCASCSKPLCTSCGLEFEGRQFCDACGVQSVQAVEGSTRACTACGASSPLAADACATCGHAFGLLSGVASAPAARRGKSDEVMCAQHGDVAAVARCRVCGSGVCATCDFVFAGHVHVCPRCVEQHSGTDIRPERRRRMYWGLGLGIYGATMLGLLFLGLLHRMLGATARDQGLNTLIGFMILIPVIVGTGLSFASYDRRLHNPLPVKIAIGINSAMLAVYVVLMIIGASRS